MPSKNVVIDTGFVAGAWSDLARPPLKSGVAATGIVAPDEAKAIEHTAAMLGMSKSQAVRVAIKRFVASAEAAMTVAEKA